MLASGISHARAGTGCLGLRRVLRVGRECAFALGMPRIKIACCPKRKAQPCYSTYRYYLEAVGRDTWSGRRDSNPCLDLGKVPYYPYTTTALSRKTLARHRFGDKVLSKNDYRSEKEKALAPVAIAHSWRHETRNGIAARTISRPAVPARFLQRETYVGVRRISSL